MCNEEHKIFNKNIYYAMEQHKLVVFSVRWPKKKMKQRYVVIIFQGGAKRELDLCPKLDITFAQAFSSLPHTHTHTHTDILTCVSGLFLCKAHKEKFFRVSPP